MYRADECGHIGVHKIPVLVQRETRHIDLTVYGTLSDDTCAFTAMAQTVGRPIAIAAKLILNGMPLLLLPLYYY